MTDGDEERERSEQEKTRRYNWELESREKAWRRELDRSSQERKWDYDRQRREAKNELGRKKDDVKRELDRHVSSAGPQGISPDQLRRYHEMDDIALRAAVYVAGALAVVALFVLSTGHLAALAFSGGLPHYQPEDVPGILQRVVADPGDPAAAWAPVNTGAELPGSVAWWSIFLVLVLVLGGLSFLVYALYSTHPQAQQPRGPRADWAKAKVHPGLRVQASDGRRVVVGISGRSKLALGRLQSLLVVGPAHAGKTSGLAIPTLLEWAGPAVVASTKSHLMDETIGWRSHQGDVHVFDPAGITRYHRSGWTLLSDCGTWQGAIRMAQHLTAAAQAAPGGRLDGATPSDPGRSQLWSSAMAMSLAPFLYAAAADGRTIMDAAQWIEREERDEILTILRRVDKAAAHTHETTFVRSDPSRSSFFHLMFQVLSVYSDPTVAATANKDEIVGSELLDGGSHTLYLTAPEHDQARFQPLFATMVRQVLTAASDRFASRGAPLDPPLLLLLDEAVGVASVQDLASTAATGAAKGVQVVSIFQDLGRFDGLHPNAAGLLANNHRAMLVVAGEHDVTKGTPSSERLLWADLGAQLRPGEGALLYESAKPVRLRLRRWFQDGELSRRVAMAQDAVAPTERRLPNVYSSPIDTAPAFSLARQTGAWLKGAHRHGASSEEAGAGERAARRADSRYAELFELPEDDPPPDNVTQLPNLTERPRR